jgi:hypothetical protein
MKFERVLSTLGNFGIELRQVLGVALEVELLSSCRPFLQRCDLEALGPLDVSEFQWHGGTVRPPIHDANALVITHAAIGLVNILNLLDAAGVEFSRTVLGNLAGGNLTSNHKTRCLRQVIFPDERTVLPYCG